ncbi:hypothetical protein AB0I72_19120 [Nocardiopsis sp. NPDC049922]|uniref:hypothetical protein n=1 Tax=Nocardiopsis sp. NPDC049922 TaxID=3155157 RepID=UPI0034025E64
MTAPERETRDLLIEIKTMLGVVVSRGEDHESRIREIEQTAVTVEQLRRERAEADARTKRFLQWAGLIVGGLTLIIPTVVSVLIALVAS